MGIRGMRRWSMAMMKPLHGKIIFVNVSIYVVG